MVFEEEELERQIAQKKRELDALRRKKKEEEVLKILKPLSEYTTEEKVAYFDAQYNDAKSTLIKKTKGDYHEDNDDAQYDWEAKMELLARDSEAFWNYWRSL